MIRTGPGARRVARLLLLALLAPALGGPAVPAHASHGEPRMLVSRSDAGPFTDQLSGPLMAHAGRVVPLDVTTATFYLMNATPAPARATVSVVNRGERNALTSGLTVTVEVAGAVATGQLSPDGAPCDLVATGPRIRAGGVQPVQVDVAVGDLEGQQGTAQDFALDLDVTMSHLGGGAGPAPCQAKAAEGDRPGSEPGTSGPADPDCSRDPVVTLTGTPTCVPDVVVAGLVPRDPGAAVVTGAGWLVVGGLLLLVSRRRRRPAGAHRAD